MVEKNLDRNFDLIARRVGEDFMVFHEGTGIFAKGKSLDALYKEVAGKMEVFSGDMDKIGASDLAEFARSGGSARYSRSVRIPWISIFIVCFSVLLASVIGIAWVADKVEQKIKAKEYEVRMALENPKPEQVEARMRQFRKSLAVAEPYLIEFKKNWERLPKQ